LSQDLRAEIFGLIGMGGKAEINLSIDEDYFQTGDSGFATQKTAKKRSWVGLRKIGKQGRHRLEGVFVVGGQTDLHDYGFISQISGHRIIVTVKIEFLEIWGNFVRLELKC